MQPTKGWETLCQTPLKKRGGGPSRLPAQSQDCPGDDAMPAAHPPSPFELQKRPIPPLPPSCHLQAPVFLAGRNYTTVNMQRRSLLWAAAIWGANLEAEVTATGVLAGQSSSFRLPPGQTEAAGFPCLAPNLSLSAPLFP